MHGETFTHITFYTEKLLHKGAFTVTQTQKSLYTEKLLHGESATQRNLSHRASFYTKKLHTEALTQGNCYTEQTLHKARFYTEKLSHKDSFSTSTPKRKNDDFEALSKRNFKAKSSAPKWRRICCQSTIRNLYAATTIRFIRLPATKDTGILRTQPQQRGTLAHPFPCDLKTLGCKTQQNYAQQLHKLQLQNRISTPKRTAKSSAPKCEEKICCQSTIRNFHVATTLRFTTSSWKKH